MTFYEMTRPEDQKLGLFVGIKAQFTSVIQSLQYARMMQALNELNADQLAKIGIERKDIPRHARECIYSK